MSVSRVATLGGVALHTSTGETLHPLSVEDYHRMIEVGILTEDDKVELLDGAIVEMSPEGPAHAEVHSRLARFLIISLDSFGFAVRAGNPVTIVGRSSEPEPDFAVVQAGASSMSAHPTSALLIVEVSRTSLGKDRNRKAAIYAAAGVPEYWIVNLVDWRVEVHTEPHNGAYTKTDVVERDGVVQARAVPLPPLQLSELFAE